MTPLHLASATALAGQIRAGALGATEVTRTALARIDARNGEINAFTEITAARALADAARIDAAIAAGTDPGPLAGVPFAAKNIFDIQDVVTLAGSIIERDKPPAAADGFCVARLRDAGAICVGALNMDEYAYGFTTENTHHGACRNPHDTTRIAGGSSGGSGAAVAAGLVPISLGTDTNGSIRVPSSLNGIFGIKPTYGNLSRAGGIMFVPSLDHIGPFARSVADLAAVYDALLGPDPNDPVQARRSPAPVSAMLDSAMLETGTAKLRVARLGGHFARHGLPEAQAAADAVARAMGAAETVELPDAAAARAAAFLITASEGANQHLSKLRDRIEEIEPLTQNRLLAGALIPAQWVLHAQRVRALFRAQAAALFNDWDILVAPATPTAATPIGQDTLHADGATVKLRPSMGVYTQPISCIGLPVLTVPVANAAGPLPIGVQLIGAPWAEAALFRAAAALERDGICTAPVAPAFQD